MRRNQYTVAATFLIAAAPFGLALTAGTAWAAGEAPPRCAGYGDLQSISLTNWESGLGAWSAGTHDVANVDTFDTANWAAAGNLPGNRAGMAAFVANLDEGDCGADDESGALRLDSPAIAIPNSADVPRISVAHWFQTEFGWDGGNFKISVNGGPFNLVPASAIEYAPYSDTLFPPVDEFEEVFNTNPLADEDAFTGTIDGLAIGSWVESRINLLGIAEAGDSIRLRLDFGVDACGGEIGWYVDEVEVYACEAELPPSDCGNAVLDGGEQCDDGNDFIADGCSNTCQVESGWECSDPTLPGSIGDPGFEAGTPNPEWTEVSNNPIGTPICEVAVCNTGGGTGPSEGSFWAWFGGVSSASTEGSLSQTVVIPSSVSVLRFDLEIPACDSAADYLEVLIDGNREWVVNGSDARCGDDGYATQSVDISAYADGDSHDLEFHSETFANGGDESNFFVDVVALPGTPSLCTPTAPSLTLVKQVLNNDGGTAIPANWTLQASGPTGFSGPGPNVSSGANFQAGTYHLSESGGPPGYTASAWVCDGGTQNDADTVTLAQGQSAVCTITNDDPAQGFAINAGHAGAWFNPVTSGQGQFIDIEPASQFMFISWFTYTDDASAHPFEQRWFTAQGNYSGNTAELVIYETLGGRFDDPQVVTTLPVGEATLVFHDCEQGQMTYSIDDEGLQGAFPMQRVIPGSGNTCSELSGSSTQAVDINAGMDGSWYEPATSGQGFFIDAFANPQGTDFIFVSWFTYGDDTASGQRWLTAQGNFEGSTTVIDVNETTGGSFDDPRPPSTDKIGTMSLDFTDCSNALLSYELTDEGAAGEIPVTRVVAGSEVLCEGLAGAE
jgi:cysteine-rich repeat protein